MQSSVLTVDAYLESVPEQRRPALIRLRELCRATLAGYDESMTYKMPTYSRDGAAEVAFASQKNYIALYVTKAEVVNKHRASLPDVGKGCIRYSRPDKIDFRVVEELLQDTASSPNRPAKRPIVELRGKSKS